MRTSDRLPDECREEIRERITDMERAMSTLMDMGDGHSAHHIALLISELRRVLGDDGK